MRDEQAERGDERERTLQALQRFRTVEDVNSRDVACLLSGARRLEQNDSRERRREALLQRAADQGLDREFAELVYSAAQEEGVEPAFAFELVHCGVGVQELDDVVYGDAGSDDGMTSSALPDELLRPAPGETGMADRERRLRLSFRRLRHHIERHRTPEDALVAFAAEPDVGACSY